MFFLQQPEVIELELFSSMPAHYHRDGRRSNWADANRGGRPPIRFWRAQFSTKREIFM